MDGENGPLVLDHVKGNISRLSFDTWFENTDIDDDR